MNAKAITYLIYIVLFEALVLGGAGYVVFGLGRHPGWFALAIFMSFCAYKPQQWIHGEK